MPLQRLAALAEINFEIMITATSTDIQTLLTSQMAHPQWATILDLPIELLLMIFNPLDTHCLLPTLRTLAFLYRPLHYLLLPLVLSGVPEHRHLSSQTVALHNWETMSTLPILRRIHFVSSLRAVTFDLSNDSYHSGVQSRHIDDVRNTFSLRFLVDKVTRVEEMWIRLPQPTSCRSTDWQKAFAGLLHALATKQCTSFTIVYGTFEMRSRPPNKPRPENWRTWQLNPLPILTTFAIDSPLFAYPPFTDWTLRTLQQSSSSLSTLHLSDAISNHRLAYILPRTTLPVLVDFKIVATLLDFPVIMGFISRHLGIEILHVQQTEICSNKHLFRPILVSCTFLHLTRLSATPSIITYLFTLRNKVFFPLLQIVNIISSTCHFQLVHPNRATCIDLAFKALAPICRSRQMSLSLALEVWPACLNWLNVNRGVRAEKLLMVHHLVLLTTGSHGIYNRMPLDVLLKWLGLFPALRHVSFQQSILESIYLRGR